jgi:uncharacterized protein (TIGR03083 family)
MTMTKQAETRPRVPQLDRDTAMRLAATEYQRVVGLLSSLQPADWSKPTDCSGWDVRAMAGHLLGMAEMAASIRENIRQLRAARRRGGELLDALTALQVDERASLSADELVARFTTMAPKAAIGRRRAPSFVRRRTMSDTQLVGDDRERWTFGYLIDVILTRDPWMHRIDLVRATGAEHVVTDEHDQLIVDDLVSEWADRHGQPFTLRLSGPVGGAWSVGTGGPVLELDAIEFCRTISGRRHAEGLLSTTVPF